MIGVWISWIVIGVIAGFIASLLMNKSGEGLIGDLVLGLLGAVVGGWVMSFLNIGGGGWIWSILVATVGAIIILAIYHLVIRKSARA